jgi:hypothetical protein
VAVAGHVAADNGAVEHVERGQQRGGAVALVSRGSRPSRPVGPGNRSISSVRMPDKRQHRRGRGAHLSHALVALVQPHED